MSSNDQGNLICHQAHATLEQFWKAVDIWNNCPHVVNRRLCGVICLFVGKILNSEVDHNVIISRIRATNIPAATSVEDDDILKILKAADVQAEKDFNVSEAGVYIYFKKLLPRNYDKFEPCLELVIIDKLKNVALFTGLQEHGEKPNLTPNFPYSFCYLEEKSEIILAVKNEKSACISNVDWIKGQLFPKIIKWAETADIEGESNRLVTTSLNLVNMVKYNELYQHLKKKYGLQMIQIWPENTDPLKFVYEDVAIATYLLLLWEEERLQRGTPDVYQTFVDLGCGNGLLVHILNSEGHQGVGLDVRKRKIWDLYPSSTNLQVQPIVPSAECLFPEADWLIGNHSDELTPWIPIIAARSSYSCRFFLLPCCCYELNGQKYQRANSSLSQYMDYLDYILKLCKVCGFNTKIDRLRIPSTKRICLVGYARNYPEENAVKVYRDVKILIDSKTCKHLAVISREQTGCCLEMKGSVEEKWVQDIRIREKEEKVRNCTHLCRELVEEILKLVAEQLLNKQDLILLSSTEGEERLWNAGGRLSLEELASLIPREKIKKLKNECGGLQTLLKNNGHVFFVKCGYVQLKVPSVEALVQKKKPVSLQQCHCRGSVRSAARKQKPCWFQFNHPDGCPLSDDDCSYRHVTV